MVSSECKGWRERWLCDSWTTTSNSSKSGMPNRCGCCDQSMPSAAPNPGRVYQSHGLILHSYRHSNFPSLARCCQVHNVLHLRKAFHWSFHRVLWVCLWLQDFVDHLCYQQGYATFLQKPSWLPLVHPKCRTLEAPGVNLTDLKYWQRLQTLELLREVITMKGRLDLGKK
jgi:hypothetical protein